MIDDDVALMIIIIAYLMTMSWWWGWHGCWSDADHIDGVDYDDSWCSFDDEDIEADDVALDDVDDGGLPFWARGFARPKMEVEQPTEGWSQLISWFIVFIIVFNIYL